MIVLGVIIIAKPVASIIKILSPFKLIETVAYNIINHLKTKFIQIDKCRIKIKKINPPINGDVDFVSVIVEE